MVRLVLTLTLGLVAAAHPGSAQAPAITRVVMLGTGTPNPDPDRSGPSVAIVSGEHAYLVDAGPGLVRRAARAATDSGITALRADRLGIVFITHLHSDHTVGLPDLLHTSWVAERAGPLKVFGPPGIDRMMHHIDEAWRDDIRIRTDGTQPGTPDGWKVETTVVKPGVVYRDDHVTVTAIPVPHGTWERAFGYRFVTQDRTIVVSGDTRGGDNALADACNGCDVLVHEVYSSERLRARSPEWQRYHRAAHVSATELAAIAARARPKLLVMYHQLYWGATDADLLAEIRAAGYPGAVVAARDLGIY
jgi:ribonuclease BN (tRNA processing enzyme)